MYTVIRFMFGDNPNALAPFGEMLNRIIPGAFAGEDRVNDRFSCAISDSGDWYAHILGMLEWLTKATSLMQEARGTVARVQIDCAIEPEDVQDSAVASFMITDELISKLAELHVSFVFSVYGLSGSSHERRPDRARET